MNIVKACLKGALSLCVLTLAASGTFGQDSQIRSDLSRSFGSFDLVRVQKTQTSETDKSLAVRAAGRTFRLSVTENDIISDRYRAEDTQSYATLELARPSVNTYKGKVDGAEGSEVRLTIEGSKIVGFFDVNGDRFFVEPAKKYSDAAAADQSVVYREKDALTQQSFYCDADLPTRVENGMAAATADAQSAVMVASRTLEVATDADFEYVTVSGGAAQANANIASILNMVEGTYAAELDLSIRIVFQHTWSSVDPFAGSNSGDILTAFRSHWLTAYPSSSVPRDTAHLFSGKSAILSAGIAYVGAVCSNANAAFGVSGYVSWAPGKYLIPAHELGHNLGAEHAETNVGCGNTIMNAYLSGTAQMTFCSFSRSQITSYITTYGSCLNGGSPTPTPTPFPTATPTPTPFPTVTPTPTPFPTATPTPFPTVTPTPTPYPTVTPTPTATPKPRFTPTPTPTPTPFPTVTPTPFPTPTPTPFPTVTPTPTPFPTASPTPFPTPTPSPTPYPTPRPRFPYASLTGPSDASRDSNAMFGPTTEVKLPVTEALAFWMNDGNRNTITAGTAGELSAGMGANVMPLIGDAQVMDLSVYAF